MRGKSKGRFFIADPLPPVVGLGDDNGHKAYAFDGIDGTTVLISAG